VGDYIHLVEDGHQWTARVNTEMSSQFPYKRGVDSRRALLLGITSLEYPDA
jgi:hypothetical protein